MLCATDCISNGAVPRWGNGCGNIQQRAGGISSLLFFACNMRFATVAEGSISLTTPTGTTISMGLITDYTSWALAVQNNMIRPSPLGIGEKPASSFETEKLTSCRPAAISSETHVINFKSFDTDPDNFYDVAYWNRIRREYGKFRFVYKDCGGIVYYTGDVEDPGFEFTPTSGPGYIIPPGVETNSYWEANLSFLFDGNPDMIEVVNLSEALNIDANS